MRELIFLADARVGCLAGARVFFLKRLGLVCLVGAVVCLSCSWFVCLAIGVNGLFCKCGSLIILQVHWFVCLTIGVDGLFCKCGSWFALQVR